MNGLLDEQKVSTMTEKHIDKFKSLFTSLLELDLSILIKSGSFKEYADEFIKYCEGIKRGIKVSVTRNQFIESTEVALDKILKCLVLK